MCILISFVSRQEAVQTWRWSVRTVWKRMVSFVKCSVMQAVVRLQYLRRLHLLWNRSSLMTLLAEQKPDQAGLHVPAWPGPWSGRHLGASRHSCRAHGEDVIHISILHSSLVRYWDAQSLTVPLKVKVKLATWYSAVYNRFYNWTAALYNLGSGSW